MHICIELPKDSVLPVEWSDITPIETLYVLKAGLHNLQLFRETQLVKPLDAANAETYAAELEKRCQEDAAAMKRTLEEAHEKERARLDADKDRLVQDMQRKLDQALEYRLKNAALQQELASSKEHMHLLVQKAVAEDRLLNRSQSDLSRIAEAQALKEANDRQQQAIQQLLAELNALKQAGSVNKSNEQGKSGEQFFEELAEAAFRDFVPRFSLVNTAGTAHSGDFHVKSDSLTVLVDCKKYKAAKVGREERQKLKDDLERHAHIKLGWMVCLNRPFANAHSDLPFSFEFDGDICICYINSLELYGDAAQKIQLLRTVWTLSELIYSRMMQRSSDSAQMDHIRTRDAALSTQIQQMIRSKKELTSVIKQMKTLSERQDADLNQLLVTFLKPAAQKEETNAEAELKPPVTEGQDAFLSWYKNALCLDTGSRTKENKVGVATLHKMFKKDCAAQALNFKLADLKLYIKSKPDVFAIENPDASNFIILL